LLILSLRKDLLQKRENSRHNLFLPFIKVLEMYKQLLIILSFIAISFVSIAEQEAFIENIHASGDVGEAKITWNINYSELPTNKKLVIRYLKSNLTKLDANPDWIYSAVIESDVTNYKLSDLAVDEKYSFQIGVINDGGEELKHFKDADITWTKQKSFKTERGWVLGQGLINADSDVAWFTGALHLRDESHERRDSKGCR
jgi:hypothetical protein